MPEPRVGEICELLTGPLSGLPYLRRVDDPNRVPRDRLWLVVSAQREATIDEGPYTRITLRNMETGRVVEAPRTEEAAAAINVRPRNWYNYYHDYPDGLMYQNITVGDYLRMRPQFGGAGGAVEVDARGYARAVGMDADEATRNFARAIQFGWDPARPSRSSVDQKADQVAHELFLSQITRVQRRQFERDGWIGVLGSLGGRYLLALDSRDIYGHRMANLIGIPGRAIHSYYDRAEMFAFCFQPSSAMPKADRTLAWKLYVEADESYVLRVGVPTPLVSSEWRKRLEIATLEVAAERGPKSDKPSAGGKARRLSAQISRIWFST